MNQRAEGGFKTSGQEVEAGTFVLCRHSAFDRSGRRPELRRHQSSEGALLDRGHQWIVGSLCSGGNPGGHSRQETDAGPAEFTPGVDRGGDYYRGNVRSRHSYVCGVEMSPHLFAKALILL